MVSSPSARPVTRAVFLLAGMLAATPSFARVVVGQPAPDWSGLHWLGEPQELGDLRGRVVLVRWWTEGCSLCTATAPTLNALHDAHAKDGLVVVGVFHPKPGPRQVSDRGVRRAASRLGFAFPIAVDADWSVLRRWWRDTEDRDSTSVSFLVDRAGIVRWIHRGGEYHPSRDPDHAQCDADDRELRAQLDALLAEPAS